jgi:DnaJ-class molecular chaperone
MEEINAAYAALRTRALRQAYDAKLATQQKRAAKRQSTAAAKDTQQELIKKIKRNAIDEMGLITLFEEFFKE